VVVEVRISQGDCLRRTLRGEEAGQLDDLADRRERLGLHMNVDPVATEASPDFKFEFGPPSVAELHAMNLAERAPLHVEDDIMGQQATPRAGRIRNHEPHKVRCGEWASADDQAEARADLDGGVDSLRDNAHQRPFPSMMVSIGHRAGRTSDVDRRERSSAHRCRSPRE
jgi:hypothetical protein